jgi:hypothetical protein
MSCFLDGAVEEDDDNGEEDDEEADAEEEVPGGRTEFTFVTSLTFGVGTMISCFDETVGGREVFTVVVSSGSSSIAIFFRVDVCTSERNNIQQLSQTRNTITTGKERQQPTCGAEVGFASAFTVSCSTRDVSSFNIALKFVFQKKEKR